jgi:hypothetical protein
VRNEQIVQAFRKIEPDAAARDRVLRRVLETQTRREKPMKKKTVKWLAPVAACLVLAVAASAMLGGGRIALPNATGRVSARYIFYPFPVNISSSLVELTEDEIFNAWASVIFYGKVAKIRNIVLNFNGELEFRALASIEVGEVYRGDIAPGDILSVLLPCPINGGLWVEDTGVISRLKEGMSGIFLPRRYTETDFWEQNGAAVLQRDIAAYGMPDGERYAFLETPEGIAYSAWGFPSLPENASMEDVKELIARRAH